MTRTNLCNSLLFYVKNGREKTIEDLPKKSTLRTKYDGYEKEYAQKRHKFAAKALLKWLKDNCDKQGLVEGYKQEAIAKDLNLGAYIFKLALDLLIKKELIKTFKSGKSSVYLVM